MASLESEASCESDPNFAVVCGFLEKFGVACGLATIDLVHLQQMLEDNQEVHQQLVDLHVKLLRKAKKSVSSERWERAVVKFCHGFCSQDAWEIERIGYRKARISSKLRILKELLEAQFDYNVRFKTEINKLSADELRTQPLGRDRMGHAYWFQTDETCRIRVYKEDPDEESWALVVKDRDELVALITDLSDGKAAQPLHEEDSSSLESEKPVVDTGQTDSSNDKPDDLNGSSHAHAHDTPPPTTTTPDLQPVDEAVDYSTNKTNTSPPLSLRVKPVLELMSPKAVVVGVKEKYIRSDPSSIGYHRKAIDSAGYDVHQNYLKRPLNEEEDVEEPTYLKRPRLSRPTLLNNKRKQETSSEEEEEEEDVEEEEEVEDEIEEAPLIVEGEGDGEENCAQPQRVVVGEAIEEAVFYVVGEGSGRDCETGKEGQSEKNDSKDTTTTKPYKLGTIIDVRSDQFVAARNCAKKSRWDVVRPQNNNARDAEGEYVERGATKRSSTFFFGPSCLQAKPTTTGFFFGTAKEVGNVREVGKVEGREVARACETLAGDARAPATPCATLGARESKNSNDLCGTDVENVSFESRKDDVSAVICDKNNQIEENATLNLIENDTDKVLGTQLTIGPAIVDARVTEEVESLTKETIPFKEETIVCRQKQTDESNADRTECNVINVDKDVKTPDGTDLEQCNRMQTDRILDGELRKLDVARENVVENVDVDNKQTPEKINNLAKEILHPKIDVESVCTVDPSVTNQDESIVDEDEQETMAINEKETHIDQIESRVIRETVKDPLKDVDLSAIEQQIERDDLTPKEQRSGESKKPFSDTVVVSLALNRDNREVVQERPCVAKNVPLLTIDDNLTDKKVLVSEEKPVLNEETDAKSTEGVVQSEEKLVKDTELKETSVEKVQNEERRQETNEKLPVVDVEMEKCAPEVLVEEPVEVKILDRTVEEVEVVENSMKVVETIVTEAKERRTEVGGALENPRELLAAIEKPAEVEAPTQELKVLEVAEAVTKVVEVEEPVEKILESIEKPTAVGEAVEKSIKVLETKENPTVVEETVVRPAKVGDPIEKPIEVGVTIQKPIDVEKAMEQPREAVEAIENPTEVGEPTENFSEVEEPTEALIEKVADVVDAVEKRKEIGQPVEISAKVVETPTEVEEPVEKLTVFDAPTGKPKDVGKAMENAMEVEETVEKSREVFKATEKPTEMEEPIEKLTKVEKPKETLTKTVTFEPVKHHTEVREPKEIEPIQEPKKLDGAIEKTMEVVEPTGKSEAVVEIVESPTQVEEAVEKAMEVKEPMENFTKVGEPIQKVADVVEPVEKSAELEEPEQKVTYMGTAVEKQTEIEEPAGDSVKVREPIQKVADVVEPTEKSAEPEEPMQKVTDVGTGVEKHTEIEEPTGDSVKVREPIQKVADVVEPIKEYVELEEPVQNVTEVGTPVEKQTEEPTEDFPKVREPIQKVTDVVEPIEKSVVLEGHMEKVADMGTAVEKQTEIEEPREDSVKVGEPIQRVADVVEPIKKSLKLEEPMQRVSEVGTAVEKQTEEPTEDFAKVREPIQKVTDVVEPTEKSAVLQGPMQKVTEVDTVREKPTEMKERTQKSLKVEEPIQKVAHVLDPIKKSAELREPIQKVTEVATDVENSTKVEKPIQKVAEVAEPAEKITELLEPVGKSAKEEASKQKLAEVGKPIRESVKVVEPKGTAAISTIRNLRKVRKVVEKVTEVGEPIGLPAQVKEPIQKVTQAVENPTKVVEPMEKVAEVVEAMEKITKVVESAGKPAEEEVSIQKEVGEPVGKSKVGEPKGTSAVRSMRNIRKVAKVVVPKEKSAALEEPLQKVTQVLTAIENPTKVEQPIVAVGVEKATAVVEPVEKSVKEEVSTEKLPEVAGEPTGKAAIRSMRNIRKVGKVVGKVAKVGEPIGKTAGKKEPAQVEMVEKPVQTGKKKKEPAVSVSDSDSDDDHFGDSRLSDASKEGADDANAPITLATFKMDHDDDDDEVEVPVPVTRRITRKRSAAESFDQPMAAQGKQREKRAKLKPRSEATKNLRKIIEEQKQSVVSSSDEDEAKDDGDVIEIKDEDDKDETSKSETTDVPIKKARAKKKRTLLGLDMPSDDQMALTIEDLPVRQSRRIAQIKIKEAERKEMEELAFRADVEKQQTKKKKQEDADYKVVVDKRKRKNKEENSEEEETTEVESDEKKKRKRKRKNMDPRKFDSHNPWKSSSGSSSSEVEEEEEEAEEDYDHHLVLKSDHEFSPESDLEGDAEVQPMKRARTARKESDNEEDIDDCACQKCGKKDHPEWILLCDKCDSGWHCSCLRPALLVIPEGDWFCPPCQHETLVKQLEAALNEHDHKMNKREREMRRKERLAYVGISLDNVLPSKETDEVRAKVKRRGDDDGGAAEEDSGDADDDDHEDDDDDADVQANASGGEESASDESGSASGTATSESDSDEPIYQLRQRRQARSYKFNDYDELINSAIQDEMEAVAGAGNQGRGKDIATIVNAEKEEEAASDAVKEELSETTPTPLVSGDQHVQDVKDKQPPPAHAANEEDDDEEVIRPARKIIGRKKHRKLNSLDVSSGDDAESDEDFKGTSSDSDEEDYLEEDDLSSESSDDYGSKSRRRKHGPVRRSTRARFSRFDREFINDDSDDSEAAPARKKTRSIWDSEEEEEESDDSDTYWSKRKRKKASSSRSKKTKASSRPKKNNKKKKRGPLDDSDVDYDRMRKRRIKYGGLNDGESRVEVGRRTRGKKINYLDALGTDSEDEVRRKPARIEESEDEYDVTEEKDQVRDSDESVDQEILTSIQEDLSKNPKKLRTKGRGKSGLKIPRKPKVAPPAVPTTEPPPVNFAQPPDVTALNFHAMDLPKPPAAATAHPFPPAKLIVPAGDIQDHDDEGGVGDEPNPIEQINKNLEQMDEHEMEKMMEEEDYANRQLQLVAMQLEKEKKRKEREAKRVEKTTMAPTVAAEKKTPKKRGRKPKNKSESPALSLFNDAAPMMMGGGAGENAELSEPPGLHLPMFGEIMGADEKKTANAVGGEEKVKGVRESEVSGTEAAAGGNVVGAPDSPMHGSKLGIVTPPQPFAQSQPAPSVITRMLQSPNPAHGGFAPFSGSGAAPPGAAYHSGAVPRGPAPYPSPATGQFLIGRGVLALPPQHRQLGPGAGAAAAMPPMSPLYHPHRQLDPSPSGGGPINISPTLNRDRSSPLTKEGPAPPAVTGAAPPPYARPFPAGARHLPMPHPPPPHLAGHRGGGGAGGGVMSPYHPGVPANYHFGAYPPSEEVQQSSELYASQTTFPPESFQGRADEHANEREGAAKQFEEEGDGGEFGGLVSYFSSQREDELNS